MNIKEVKIPEKEQLKVSEMNKLYEIYKDSENKAEALFEIICKAYSMGYSKRKADK